MEMKDGDRYFNINFSVIIGNHGNCFTHQAML
jgi:hypothetical protein